MIFKILIGIFTFSTANAITVVDDFSTKDTPDGTTYNISSGYSGSSGNSQYKKIGVNVKAIHNDHNKFILGKAEYNYGDSNGVKNIDRHLLHARIGFKASPNYQEEVFVQYQKDQFSKLKHRYLIGSDIALFGELESLEYRVGLGLFYENSNKDGIIFPATRINNYYFLKYSISESAVAKGTIYYQPNIVDFNDRKILTSGSIESKITESTSIVISAKYEYDSKPALGVRPWDLSYKTSLVFSF